MEQARDQDDRTNRGCESGAADDREFRRERLLRRNRFNRRDGARSSPAFESIDPLLFQFAFAALAREFLFLLKLSRTQLLFVLLGFKRDAVALSLVGSLLLK